MELLIFSTFSIRSIHRKRKQRHISCIFLYSRCLSTVTASSFHCCHSNSCWCVSFTVLPKIISALRLHTCVLSVVHTCIFFFLQLQMKTRWRDTLPSLRKGFSRPVRRSSWKSTRSIQVFINFKQRYTLILSVGLQQGTISNTMRK